MRVAAAVAGVVAYAFTAVAALQAQGTSDVVMLGARYSNPFVRVALPVYVRDVSGTRLGMDQDARIQHIVLTVHFSDPANISGCTEPQVPECAVSFRPTELLSNAKIITARGSSSIEIEVQVDPDHPTAYTLDKAAPGDHIGDLMVISDDEAAGTIAFTLDPSPTATFLGGPLGAGIRETVGNELTLLPGSLTVCSEQVPSEMLISYSSAGCALGLCRKGEPIVFKLELLGYTLQPCDTVEWAFGDGTSGTGVETSHTYDTIGPFNVTATVTSLVSGIPVSTTKTIQIAHATQVCECTASGPELLSIGTPVTFTAASNCTVTSYEWDFGDGTPRVTITSPTITHTFGASGLKTWSVRITTPASDEPCMASGNVVVLPGNRRRAVRSQ